MMVKMVKNNLATAMKMKYQNLQVLYDNYLKRVLELIPSAKEAHLLNVAIMSNDSMDVDFLVASELLKKAAELSKKILHLKIMAANFEGSNQEVELTVEEVEELTV